MIRPTQAVILAGGLGSRLAPLTDTKPKPMIEFHGRPFLEYLIVMLREQGFQKVLLLLGYLPEVVTNYFGDGSRWGIAIEYSISPVENDTGKRLKLAQDRIEPLCLLLYCDNYWPLDFDAIWNHFQTGSAQAQITVYRNRDAYTRDNVRVDENGTVLVYDKDRKMAGLQGVDIGFIILKHEVIERLSQDNISFEREAYPQLVQRGQLRAFTTGHRYYSVGSHQRLPLTEEFLKRRPTVFLDRDGVLNKKMPRATYVCSPADWEWLPGSLEALRLLKANGYRSIVITNQPGIARGAMTKEALDSIHEKMKAEASAAGGEIDSIYSCLHNWDEGCECRKPKPGLLFQAQRDLQLDLSRTCFIGDDERDVTAAKAAGCPWEFVSETQSFLDVVRTLVAKQPQSEVDHS